MSKSEPASEPSSASKPPPIPGRLGLWLAVAAILFPIVTGIVQVLVETRRADLDRELERLKFAQNIKLEQEKNNNAVRAENNRNRNEVNKLFVDSYKDAKPDKQLQTIEILVTLYPDEFVGVAKLFQINAATPRVRAKVQKAEESAQKLAQRPSAAESKSKVPTAASEELLGFRLIVKGDLAGARIHFQKAYSLFPIYHNVDEISRQVLNERLIASYKAADPASRRNIHRKVASLIVKDYSWGIPRSELQALQKLAQ
jgi:hypothetical protein